MTKMRYGHEYRNPVIPDTYPDSEDILSAALYENGLCPRCGMDLQWRLHREATIVCKGCGQIVVFEDKKKAR